MNPAERECGTCGAPASYGFQQPGPRAVRTDSWQIWACLEHRAEAEAIWARRYGTTLTPEAKKEAKP